MPNQGHLEILKQGVYCWNSWRTAHPAIVPDLGFDAERLEAEILSGNSKRAKLPESLPRIDLSRANMSSIDLDGADLRGANLRDAILRNANLTSARLDDAVLVGARLDSARLAHATLLHADLTGASMFETKLDHANLRGATLNRVNLSGASMVYASLADASLVAATLINANLDSSDLTGCRVYGASTWRLSLNDAKQRDLIITLEDESTITVDDIRVAQFLHLLAVSRDLQNVFYSVTSKVALILGRFANQQLEILESIRQELREHDYVPLLFDFQKPANSTTMETVELLARLSRFVIADLTDPRSVLQELQAIVPSRPSLPVQLIMCIDQVKPGMVDHLQAYRNVLPIFQYADKAGLLQRLGSDLIPKLENKRLEILHG